MVARGGLPFLKDTLLTVGAYGRVTPPGILGVSPWVVILPVQGLGLVLTRWFDRAAGSPPPAVRSYMP